MNVKKQSELAFTCSILACCIFSLATGTCMGFIKNQGDTSRVNFLLKSGRKNYYLGNFQVAILNFKQAIQIEPSNSKAYRFKGDAEIEISYYDSAIKDYTKAIYLNRNDTLAYKGRAESKRYKMDADGAIRDYDKVIEWDKTDPLMYYGRADCLYRLMQFKQVIVDVSLALEKWGQRPHIEEAYKLRGNSYLRVREYLESISDFNSYFKFGGADPSCYQRRGLAYSLLYTKRNAHYADSAISNFKKAVFLSPNRPDGYRSLGSVYAQMKDSIHARENFEKAFNLDSTDGYTLLLWAHGEIAIRNFKRAIDLFEDANGKKQQFNAEDYYDYGISLWGGRRDTLSALANFEKAENIDGKLYNLYRSRFELLFGVPRYSDIAIKDITQLMKAYKNPKLVGELYAARSFTRIQIKDFVAAKLDIEKAIELSPSEPINYIIHGFLRFITNEDDQLTLQDYDKSISINMNFAQSYVMKSYLYRERSNKDKACQNLNLAEKLGAKVPVGVKEYICNGKILSSSKDSALQFVIYPYIKDSIIYPKK